MSYFAAMYVVELEFTSDPRRLAARPAHRERLLAWHREGVLVMAGPWADDSGALLVFDVADEAALRRLIDADPYFRAPGVSVRRTSPWSPLDLS
ncbi:hypothetical protein GCM10022226_54000 [Sphaerisporangium flaviroseum]|uniref:YCII-related domain-containing protein n=1 Tax=Sphaerisporangium flaviroseum TaxID=509199 RepID=A0ABP7IU76_9ACTN